MVYYIIMQVVCRTTRAVNEPLRSFTVPFQQGVGTIRGLLRPLIVKIREGSLTALRRSRLDVKGVDQTFH